jgi:hypothetical protein
MKASSLNRSPKLFSEYTCYNTAIRSRLLNYTNRDPEKPTRSSTHLCVSLAGSGCDARARAQPPLLRWRRCERPVVPLRLAKADASQRPGEPTQAMRVFRHDWRDKYWRVSESLMMCAWSLTSISS